MSNLLMLTEETFFNKSTFTRLVFAWTVTIFLSLLIIWLTVWYRYVKILRNVNILVFSQSICSLKIHWQNYLTFINWRTVKISIQWIASYTKQFLLQLHNSIIICAIFLRYHISLINTPGVLLFSCLKSKLNIQIMPQCSIN